MASDSSASTEQASREASSLHHVDFTDHIEVLVGQDKKKFTVHRDIICSRSTFFQAALSARWQEESKPVELPEDLPDVFNTYLSFLYTQAILQIFEQDQPLKRHSEAEDHHILRTYVLADKLGDIVTANMIADEIVIRADQTHKLPHTSILKLLCETTSEKSPIQQLFVDFWVHESGVAAMGQLCNDDSVPLQFFRMILMERAVLEEAHAESKVEKLFESGYTANHKCRYRQHNSSNPSCGEGCGWSS